MLRANEQIGGAIVRRAFFRGTESVKAGTILTPDEVAAMPISNRRVLASAGVIDLFPAIPDDAPGHDLFLMHVGHGRFDVIEGRRLNAEPLTKDEARALLARRSPDAPAEGDEIAA